MIIKTVGLAAIAALVAMAFVGASTASASTTSLCKVDQDPCQAANQITHIHKVDTTALWLNDITDFVECQALFLGDILSSLVTNGPMHIIGDFTYSNCEDGFGTSCTFAETSATTLIAMLRGANELAKKTGEGILLIRCGFFIHCIYNDVGLSGTVEGPLHSPPNGLLQLHNQKLTSTSGFPCPSVAELDVLFEPLIPTYVKS